MPYLLWCRLAGQQSIKKLVHVLKKKKKQMTIVFVITSHICADHTTPDVLIRIKSTGWSLVDTRYSPGRGTCR